MMTFLLFAPASTKRLGWRKDKKFRRDRSGRFCDICCAVILRYSFVFISPIVWNMCENLLYESLYFKERHNQQEYYWPTIYRTGAVVVSTITCYYRANWDIPEKFSVLCMEYSPTSFSEFFKILCYKGNHFSFSFHYLSFSLVPWRRHYCRNVGEDS